MESNRARLTNSSSATSIDFYRLCFFRVFSLSACFEPQSCVFVSVYAIAQRISMILLQTITEIKQNEIRCAIFTFASSGLCFIYFQKHNMLVCMCVWM